MSPGLTAERVYAALKRELKHGDLRPGDRLDPARLARELGASPTPVRDALHRLLGEDLVHARAHDGFHVPVPSEADLRDLYEWNRDLLLLALRKAGGSAVPDPGVLSRQDSRAGDPEANAGDRDVASAVAGLFREIAASAASRQLARAVQHASDRLHPVRRVEAEAIAASWDEVASMRGAWAAGATGDLRRQIGAYHRRRVAGVVRLAPLLTTPGQGPG
ncbi:GntR family transcriptional regulator [Novosphingobium malaysiense]|uniref:GntR family transcriptional regulator n=1 Tax=Novosphingobium malaysiense TaxID=1348853 RepID=UPI00068CBC97|nr:GntR family transcriptional regulator [Novosphingobium malaysiense]